jgi:hypothetical protein
MVQEQASETGNLCVHNVRCSPMFPRIRDSLSIVTVALELSRACSSPTPNWTVSLVVQLDDFGVLADFVRYTGFHDNNSAVTTYHAIPYAYYAERFDPSKPIDKKPGISPHDVVNASKHGAACINFNLPPPYNKGFEFLLGATPIKPQSEDCLSLDVYVPDGAFDDLPVLFFTPGGGFLVGASFAYDLTALVSRGAAIGMPFIGVSINYRLGPLGFLNPSTWGQNLNLGLLDQVEALRYVKKHITAFGGDPEKVTISKSCLDCPFTCHEKQMF